MTHNVPCPECGTVMTLRPSKFKNGLWYGCPRWPACKGTHSAHADGTPMGKPANQETKQLRIKAHAAFDKLWKHCGRMTRGQAYRHMQEIMGLSQAEAHIGMFDAAQCRKLIELLEAEEAT